MKRHRTTGEERKRIERFLKRHSGQRDRFGPQCRVHRQVDCRTDRQLLALLTEETGLRPSRPWLAALCDELGIVRRRLPGPPPLPAEDKRKRAKERYDRWLAKLRKDTAAYEEWRKERRRQNADYRQQRAAPAGA